MSQPPKFDSVSPPEQLDLRALVRPVWRRKWVVALIVVIAGAGTYALVSRMPKRYSASTRLFIEVADPASAVNSTQPPAAPSPENMADLATLFTAQGITAAVDRRLDIP